MTVRVIVPPAPFLPLERVKRHLNIEAGDSDFDSLVAGYLAAAVAWIDGPAGWLGRCLGEQVLELVGSDFPTCPLRYQPIIEIVSVAYTDMAGIEQVVPGADYRLLSDGRLYAENWPTLGAGPESVRIRYRAGYADRIVPPTEPGGEPVRVSTVPEPICQAVLLLIGQWFRTRSAVNIGNIVNEMPFAVDALLSPYRVWR